MKRTGNLALVEFGSGSDSSAVKRMVNGKTVNEVPMPKGRSRRITTEMAKAIKERVNQAAIDAAKEHGISVSVVLQSFDDSLEQLEHDITVRFSAECPAGHDRFTKALLRRGNKFKCPVALYGHSFIKGTTEHIATGLDDTDQKRPLIRLRTPNGNVMADLKAVIRFLKDSQQMPEAD